MQKVKKVTILGASLGGLSAGITLLEKGVEVLLIDASPIPVLKTCGEFLSHEAIRLLETFGIRPKREVKEAYFYYKDNTIMTRFPHVCGSIPRLELENTLLKRFVSLEGKTLLGTKVHQIIPGPPFQLCLDQERVVEASHLIISSGRFQGMVPSSPPPYIGSKNHYETPYPPEALHMTFFEGGYCGISPLDEKTTVVSSLMKQKGLIPLETILSSNPAVQEHFKGATPLLTTPLTTPVGAFGPKKLPLWEGSYFVGDAAGTATPIFGQGMTLALASGRMAAEYASKGEWMEYRKAWKREYLSRIRWSLALHSIALSPLLARPVFPFLKRYPKLLEALFRKSLPRNSLL